MEAAAVLSTLVMAYRAAAGDRRINAASFNVMPLDFDTEARIGALHSKPLIDVRPERHGERDLAHRYIVVHEFVDLVAASRVKRAGEKEQLVLTLFPGAPDRRKLLWDTPRELFGFAPGGSR